MKPTFAELFFASRYMLPLWVVGSGWLWFSGHGDFIWGRLNENDRVLVILFLSAIAAGMLKAFPKVWAYEQERRDYAAAGRDPEAVKRRRRLMLRLLAIAGWGGSLWWVTENSYAGNPDLYRAALVIAAGGSLWALVAVYSRLPASLQNRLRRSGSGEQESFIVRWSLPVVKHAPNRKQIHTGLPDYCKLVLTT